VSASDREVVNSGSSEPVVPTEMGRLPTRTKLMLRILSASDLLLRRFPVLTRVVNSRLSSRLRRLIVPDVVLAARADESRTVSFRVKDVELVAPAHYMWLYLHRDYEPLLVSWLKRRLPIGGSVVDVGAHIGYLSIVMSHAIGASGHVTALEPDATNRSYLRENLRRNGATNVQVLELAASNQTGSRDFHLTASSDSHGFYDHPLTPTVSLVSVPTARLDELVRPPIDLVKVDVEGAELDVLDGMAALLESDDLRSLVVEWTPACQIRAGHAIEELPSRLRELGYELTVFDDIQGRVRSVAEVVTLWNAGRLDDGWYSNLVCERTRPKPVPS